MNAKGTVLCPCLSGHSFARCCGPYAEVSMCSGDHSVSEAKRSLRRHLLELVRVAGGMQELWFACLENLPPSLHEAVDHLSTQQLFLDHFLWDWFKKYSDARPIVRVARYFEPTDLRLANHLDGWSLTSWEPWIVMGQDRGLWHLTQLAGHREVEVHRTFEHHHWEVGDALLTRILHHAGHDFTGLHVSRFHGSAGIHKLESQWNALAHKHGFPAPSRLRPDIHNEIWLALHEDLLAMVLKVKATPAPVLVLAAEPITRFDETLLDLPQPELAGQTPKEAARNELGRHRLRKWLDNQTLHGIDTHKVRKKLSL